MTNSPNDVRVEDHEAQLIRSWRTHRLTHAHATETVRRASRAATDAIVEAHQAGMSVERISEVLRVGIGAVQHRLRDAELAAQPDQQKGG